MAAEPQKNREIIGFRKRKFLFFNLKPRPIYSDEQPAMEKAALEKVQKAKPIVPKRPGSTPNYIQQVVDTNRAMTNAIIELKMNVKPEVYVRRVIIYSVVISIAIGIGFLFTFVYLDLFKSFLDILLPILLIPAFYFMIFKNFLAYPVRKTVNSGKEIEKDVLFAVRDMIVSMRSGMPLFNAMVVVSEGYGAASREFGKIIEYVQLGMPMEQAIDTVNEQSKSKTFKRFMVQASMSIKTGADIINVLTEETNAVSQERVIELRRYGQRLNALAMFYMIFGVILPSMGIAILAVLSSFINIFTINGSTLILIAIGIFIIQFLFLNFIKSSRPAFAT